VPAPLYPGSIDVAADGDERYFRRYERQPGQLVVRFEDPGNVDGIADALRSHDLDPLIDPFEPHIQHQPFLRGGRRWVRFAGSDAQLRDLARAIVADPTADALSATPVFQPDDGDAGEAAIPLTGDLLVKIEPGYVAPVTAQIRELGFVPQIRASVYLPDPWWFFRLEQGLPRDAGFDLIRDVRLMRHVESAEFDWLKVQTYELAFPDDPPDDLDPIAQWNLVQIGMGQGWKLAEDQISAPVAVLDSGFDLQHEDLEFAGAGRSLDAEHLWETGAVVNDAGPSSWGHGTLVAGIVGARTNNNVGVASVAGLPPPPAAGVAVRGIVPIRLGDTPSAGRVAAALNWVLQQRVRVANLSLTTVASSTLVDQIDACCEITAAWPGMVICAASGNALDGHGPERVGFPARHVDVIGVGATEKDDARVSEGDPTYGAWQSRFGDGLDVVAPGIECRSTDETDDAGFVAGTKYANIAGTSAATPHVAGLAGLILATRPALDRARVRNIIEKTCFPPLQYRHDFDRHPERGPNAPLWQREVGCGRIDVARALDEADVIALEDPPALLDLYDPCDLEDAVVYTGFVGIGPRPGSLWRLYEAPTLDRWIEFDEGDVIRTAPINGGAKGRRFWIRRGAPIRQASSRALGRQRN
jgi:Subtilase family